MDNQDQYSRPRRGRPPGPNRTPLSRSERRARNAEYERQRRELIGVGISRLEPLVGATPETPRAEVLVQTVCYINSARDSIESLRRENQELKDQIFFLTVAEYQRKQRELLKRAAESSRMNANFSDEDGAI
ncbi:hypothetical protein ABMA28_007734 [Loxostege sticticalis]|uniref:BHLH domain-containing protein n=1 Tax=Loxostege sticticalis TaxID=481309 RepID=A0ABD0SKT2_LOXSC